jgi:hypothetical protein
LRADVGENAQAVSHKAEQQGERDVFCGEVQFFTPIFRSLAFTN